MKKFFYIKKLIVVSIKLFLITLFVFNVNINFTYSFDSLFNAQQDIKIKVLQKTGSDNDNMVFLILAEGYKKDEESKFDREVKSRFTGMMTQEPYCSYAKHINAYTVFVPSNESGISADSDTVDTYFGLKANGKTIVFRNEAYLNKSKNLQEYVEKNYLDNNANVTTMHFLINTTVSIGSASGSMYSFSSVDYSTNGDVMAHEMSHSIGNLADEYGRDSTKANVSNTADKNNIKWKNMIGFRNIRIVEGNATNVWIPSNQKCMMYELGRPFCEVCKLQLVRKFYTYINDGPKIYIAQPELTKEFNINHDSENFRINQNNITTANDDTISLRTVIQNLENVEKHIKLLIEIKSKTGKIKYTKSETFTLPSLVNSNNFENATIYPQIKVSIWDDNIIEKDDELVANVEDIDTGEIIATYNDLTYENYNINYMFDDNMQIPNTYISIINIPTSYDINLFLDTVPEKINGYNVVNTKIEGNNIYYICDKNSKVDTKQKYMLKTDIIGKGAISLSKNEAIEDDEIIINVVSNSSLKRIAVYKVNGEDVNVLKNATNNFSFTMPNMDIVVVAEFE